MKTTKKPINAKLQRRMSNSFFSATATLTFTRGEFFMCALTRNREAKRLPQMGESGRLRVLGRARPVLLVAAEDRRDLHRQENGRADDSERDQGDTHHHLHQLIALFPFLGF